jgi:hypothetical protein
MRRLFHFAALRVNTGVSFTISGRLAIPLNIDRRPGDCMRRTLGGAALLAIDGPISMVPDLSFLPREATKISAYHLISPFGSKH